jgi:hypothetical protein
VGHLRARLRSRQLAPREDRQWIRRLSRVSGRQSLRRVEQAGHVLVVGLSRVGVLCKLFSDEPPV